MKLWNGVEKIRRCRKNWEFLNIIWVQMISVVRLHKDCKKKKKSNCAELHTHSFSAFSEFKVATLSLTLNLHMHTHMKVRWKNFGPAFGCKSKAKICLCACRTCYSVRGLSQEVQFEVKTTQDTYFEGTQDTKLKGHEISNTVAKDAWPLISAGFFFTNSMYLHKYTDYRPELKQLWKPINHSEPKLFRNHLARNLRSVQSIGQMKNVGNKDASEHIRKARRAGLWSAWGRGRTRDQQMNFDSITRSEPDLGCHSLISETQSFHRLWVSD